MNLKRAKMKKSHEFFKSEIKRGGGRKGWAYYGKGWNRTLIEPGFWFVFFCSQLLKFTNSSGRLLFNTLLLWRDFNSNKSRSKSIIMGGEAVSVRVIARIRPINKNEQKKGEKSVIIFKGHISYAENIISTI